MTEEKQEEKLGGNKVFLSKAFLVEVEKKTYGLFRSIEIETPQGVREKVRDVGPIDVLREIEGQEQPDMETFHPTEKRLMKLKSLTKAQGLKKLP